MTMELTQQLLGIALDRAGSPAQPTVTAAHHEGVEMDVGAWLRCLGLGQSKRRDYTGGTPFANASIQDTLTRGPRGAAPELLRRCAPRHDDPVRSDAAAVGTPAVFVARPA
jgi:hypothetical protein